MLRPNDQIGPYTLVRQLGKGAFGVVWLAEKRSAITTTQVALKLALDEEPDLKAIKREADVWVQAGGHPNVLPIIDADIYEGQIVVVSEYAPDGSLEGWLKKYGGAAPTIDSAIAMAAGILAGLEHLHSKRIIHRDLKPANILLQGEIPRLADFGLARVLKSTSSTAGISGTPVYMAPETFEGKRSEQSDIWAVGVMLYQLVSGSVPFPQTDLIALMGAIVQRDPEPLPRSVPDLITEVISRALKKDPAGRFQSASEMRAILTGSRMRNENRPVEKRVPTAKIDDQTTERVKQPSKKSSKKSTHDRLPDPTLPPKESPLSNASSTSTTLPDSLKKLDKPHLQSSERAGPAGRPILRFLFFAVALAVIAGIVYAISQAGLFSVKPIQRQTFDFQTATVDLNGLIKDRRQSQARYFTETLSDTVKLDMVEIPAGSFQMGSTDTEARNMFDNFHSYCPGCLGVYDFGEETPQHQVRVPGLFMGKFEVTQEQWQALMGTNPSYFKGDKLPVENISWNDAVEFCKRLSDKVGRRYRLPSEAEWEYCCRAGTTTAFNFGEGIGSDTVNFMGVRPFTPERVDSITGKTIEAGSLGLANAYGLYDMHGNVWEWCQDIYHYGYKKAPADGSAWEKGWFEKIDDSQRVLRGGSYRNYGYRCRSASRNHGKNADKGIDFGLRIVTDDVSPK